MFHVSFHRFFSIYSYNLFISFHKSIFITSFFCMHLINKLKILYIRLFLNVKDKNRILFQHFFFGKQYFLHKTASLENMAKILNMKPEFLNQLVLEHYGMDFDNLCQMYRFRHFWSEFTNPINSDLPIQSIIQSCGFQDNKAFSDLIANHKESSKNILKKFFS